MKKALAFVLLLATAASAQKQFPSYSGVAASLPTCVTSGVHYTITNAPSTTDCTTTGGGSSVSECVCLAGTWTSAGSGGGGPAFGTLTANRALLKIGSTVTTDVTSSYISGLSPAVWLDAYQDDANLNDGDTVSTAVNYGSLGGDFVQTLTKRPLFKTAIANGLPVYRFDGVNDCLASTSTVALTTFTVVTVTSNTTGSGVIWEHSASVDANAGGLLLQGGSNTFRVRRNSAQISRSGLWMSNYVGLDQVFQSQVVTYGGNFRAFYLYVNGVLDVTTTAPVTAGTVANLDSSTATATFFVGDRNCAAGFPANMDLAELLVFTPALTNDQRKMVDIYIAQKYEF